MCINCNLTAPINHHICDLLGIPRNQYGVVSNSMDILDQLITYIGLDYRYNKSTDGEITLKLLNTSKNERSETIIKLYEYLNDHNLYIYIENLVKDAEYHPSCVDRRIINYIGYKYFDNNWINDTSVLENFKVPLELLSSDADRMKSLFGRVKYIQTELIPDDIVDKLRLTRENAELYDFQMLPEQNFYNAS